MQGQQLESDSSVTVTYDDQRHTIFMNNPPKMKSAVLEINNPKVTSVHFTLNDAAMVYNDLMGEADVELSELCKLKNPLNRVAIYNQGQLVAGIFIEPKFEDI